MSSARSWAGQSRDGDGAGLEFATLRIVNRPPCEDWKVKTPWLDDAIVPMATSSREMT
jgi:hypothetical protein